MPVCARYMKNFIQEIKKNNPLADRYVTGVSYSFIDFREEWDKCVWMTPLLD